MRVMKNILRPLLVVLLTTSPAMSDEVSSHDAAGEAWRRLTSGDWIRYTEFETREELFKAGLDAAKNEDYPTAIKYLLPLAIDGNAQAQAKMALFYRDGLGVRENFCAMTLWADKAARQGNLFGVRLMSLSYDSGDGVRKNPEMAYRWMKYAALQGDAQAQEQLNFVGVGLLPEERDAIDRDMTTWDPTKQPVPEFFYIDKGAVKDNIYMGLHRLVLGVKGCR
jgi:hypothetical protein